MGTGLETLERIDHEADASDDGEGGNIVYLEASLADGDRPFKLRMGDGRILHLVGFSAIDPLLDRVGLERSLNN